MSHIYRLTFLTLLSFSENRDLMSSSDRIAKIITLRFLRKDILSNLMI